MRGRSQARYRPWASYSLLMVLWLPQWPHLAAFIPHSEEGCNKRESVSCYVWVFWGASIRYNPANTDTGSWLLWGSSRVPRVLNGGGAAETNHSPFPPSTTAKQVTLVSPPTGRDHTVFLSVQDNKGHLCLHLGSGDSPPLHTNNALLFS